MARLKALTAAFMVIAALALTAGITAVAWLALQSSQQSEESTRQSEQNYQVLQSIKDVNHRLIDCTEPGGECYRQGQSRTAKAVVGINEGTLRVIVAALACQESGVTGERALARCTAQHAASSRPQP